MPNYERIASVAVAGYADGFIFGHECPEEAYTAQEIAAYRLGYEKGVADFCRMQEANHA